MKKNTPDMKLRVSPTLREMIETAAKQNFRTLNAEVIARLEWSFEKGYDLDAENDAIKNIVTWRNSQHMKLERKIVATEWRLEERIEKLEEQVAKLEQIVTAND